MPTSPAPDPFMEAAIAEARQGFAEGGLPIGSVLVCDGQVIGRGHNRRVQDGSVIHHAEMNCFENTGRQPAGVYPRCTLYSTLSPCHMCSGAMIHYGIKKCVVGENRTIMGAEDFLRSRDVEVTVVDSAECFQLMEAFIRKSPEIWKEDIGAYSLADGFAT